MPFVIASCPPRSVNPYLGLFYGALAEHGVAWGRDFRLSLRWLYAKRAEIDAVHFHWPEQLWKGQREWSVRALLKLQAFLLLARVLNIKRIWTVHNLQAHEGHDWRDRWGQRLLAQHCDLLIVHTMSAKNGVQERLRPRASVVVMPHGNYEGCYPAPRSRDAIREELCLDGGRPVVSCIGWLRDYKGLDLACDAAARLGGEVQFVIAGPVHESFDARGLQQQADTLPYLKLIMRRLTDQEFVDILAASDAVLLPYRAITGSGVLLAAWTQGRGVVASDLEFFREALAGGRPAGALFEADSAPALAKAIRTYLDIGPEKRRRSALAEAAKFSWDRCVTPVADVVRGWQHAEGITPVDFAPPMESP